MKPLLPIAFALIFSTRLLSAEADAFSAANRLYSEGRFAEACAAYERLLGTGATSPALEFNDGNAEIKVGHLGKAIAAYRRAALLAPRDPEVRANLEFARDQVPGAVWRESRWKSWLGLLSLDDWTILVAAAFWLTLLGLSAGQIRPAWQTRLRRPVGALATLAVLSGVALTWQ
ncbi:MAG TPA: hypothetical protein VN541_12225, partial [Tepidisphaeraceae bacterium]|nr:hypothetical protein [Tepidisphaeraceae bacterium]